MMTFMVMTVAYTARRPRPGQKCCTSSQAMRHTSVTSAPRVPDHPDVHEPDQPETINLPVSAGRFVVHVRTIRTTPVTKQYAR